MPGDSLLAAEPSGQVLLPPPAQAEALGEQAPGEWDGVCGSCGGHPFGLGVGGGGRYRTWVVSDALSAFDPGDPRHQHPHHR